MTSRSTLAQIRFGTGLAPGLPGADPGALLETLMGPDHIAQVFRQENTAERTTAALRYHNLRQARRESDAALAAFEAEEQQMRADMARQLATSVVRGIATHDGLRERLTWFWADHFTTVGRRQVMRGSITAYVEDAIRPHVAGRFGDMLEAAILHPVMILYLDQDRSVGPNSRQGLRRGRSLNENLARELLELHTLGVGAGYTQTDVREMAELLTGVGIAQGHELVFRPGNAEPGAETVFGVSYGGANRADLSEIRAALQDLALRPETAWHLSGKLADYFLSDTPDAALVDAMAATYLQSGGDLLQVMQTMLADPYAWAERPGRVKRPFHFIVSALRALGANPDRILDAPFRLVNRELSLPMLAMGQRWQGAAGPDGFFDDDQEWIRPQAMAARIGWSMTAPQRWHRRLPDPREFVQISLGDAASDNVQWAAARAETRAEGIGIILASPDFIRS